MTVLASASTASQVEPGLLGFLVVAGIGVALFFLLRSMNKQLHKVSADRRYFSGRTDVSGRAEVPGRADSAECAGSGPDGPQERPGDGGHGC